MPTLTDLNALVEKFAAAIPNLNLDGDDQEEYSTMLLWLQNQVETAEQAAFGARPGSGNLPRVEHLAPVDDCCDSAGVPMS